MTYEDYRKIMDECISRHNERLKEEAQRLAAFEADAMNFPWEMYVGDSSDEQPPTPNDWNVPIKSIEEVFPSPKVESEEERNERLWKLVCEASRGS